MEWHIIPTGRVWVESGGAMGLVPHPLWLEHQPADDQQRTPMDLNSLLIFSQGKTILVDTGLGHKLSDKAAKNWGLEWPEGTLLENLAKFGVQAADVDLVIHTHLHSDHCGGNTFLEGDTFLPTFPNAQYWVQQIEFADASHPDARTRGTYIAENFVSIWENGNYQFLHGDTQVTDTVRTVLTRGHTRGHQSILIEDGTNPPVLFVSDLASYAIHFAKTGWVTAYDVEPLETIIVKEKWQKWAAENEAVLIFQHDTHTRQGQLINNDRGKYEIVTLEAGSIAL